MSLFQANLRKQIRNLPKILNFVLKKFTIILNYLLHSLEGSVGGDTEAAGESSAGAGEGDKGAETVDAQVSEMGADESSGESATGTGTTAKSIASERDVESAGKEETGLHILR